MSEDYKYDKGKSRVDLLLRGCPNAIESIGDVLGFGASKYKENSWQGVEDGENRYLAALIRHLIAYQKGEELDKESGLPHLSHAATNAMFILELYYKRQIKNLGK